MNLAPMTVARYGVYLAAAAAGMSVYLGYQAGATLDYCLLRSVFIFIVVSALGFGAEAVLTVGWAPAVAMEAPQAQQEETNEPGDDE